MPVHSKQKSCILSRLAQAVLKVEKDHPVRVAVDGVDASGKTTLSDDLAPVFQSSGRQIIRASVDDFLNRREIRYRQGRDNPVGFYEDTTDYPAVINKMLQPLGTGGSRRFSPVHFDPSADSEVQTQWHTATDNAILVFDGIFLHRHELFDYWDYSIFVKAGFDITLKRAEERDLLLFGNADKVREMYRTRYIPGQKIYYQEVDPENKADAVWVNDDFNNPELIFR